MMDCEDFDMYLEIEADSQMQVESESVMAQQMFSECQEHAVAESLDHILDPETLSAGPAEIVVHTPRRAGCEMPLTDFPDITPPKFRRLRAKQTVPSYLFPKPLLTEATIAEDTVVVKRSAWFCFDEEEFNQLSGRTKMQRLYDRMRVWK
jgi:hypothetical protein